MINDKKELEEKATKITGIPLKHAKEKRPLLKDRKWLKD